MVIGKKCESERAASPYVHSDRTVGNIFIWLTSACKSLSLVVAVSLLVSSPLNAQQSLQSTTDSPNSNVSISVGTTSRELPSQLQFHVAFRGKTIVMPSNLGLKLADGNALGTNCEISDTSIRKIDETFQQFPGKRRLVTARCTETIFTLKEAGPPSLEWQLVVRAYDDGVAFRFRIPKQAGLQTLRIARELTEWNLVDNAMATALPLANFTTTHEGRYVHSPVSELATDTLIGIPFLVEVPSVGWAAIAEANLTDYAGMYLKKVPGENTLNCELSPRVDDPTVAVVAELPHRSPWRVLFAGDRPQEFIESDLPLKLNEPSVIKDVSWIKPGKTTFPWWNGFYEDVVALNPGLNTETAKYYIDFCAEYGIPYHSLDGIGDKAWYSGPIVPYEGADITTAVEGLDLPAVLKYAKEKGVKLRLWMHWQGAEKHMDRAFPLYRKWGIEGVMIDFMDRDDQQMVNFQRKLLQLAAENRLTVTLHGVAAPTGLERTYPNLLNSEAVMNLEYDKWDEQGIRPAHDVTVPFTRMLAGPLDYHQGSFRTVRESEFKPQEAAPLVIGTPCRTLASYVVLQNHLPMAADYPSAYRKQPLTSVLSEIPATWDETSVIEGQVGKHVAIARRAGDEWWIGVMNDHEAISMTLPLEFLDKQLYRAEIYQDALSEPHQFTKTEREVGSNETLDVNLTGAGGALIRCVPISR